MATSAARTFAAALITSTAIVTSSAIANADDEFAWRASRPLPVLTRQPGEPSEFDPVDFESRSFVAQRLEGERDVARAVANFWSQRLDSYSRLKYSDAARPAIDLARMQHAIASRRVVDIDAELRAVRRSRLRNR